MKRVMIWRYTLWPNHENIGSHAYGTQDEHVTCIDRCRITLTLLDLDQLDLKMSVATPYCQSR